VSGFSRERLERAQVWIGAVALLMGGAIGLTRPGLAPLFASLVTPALGVLLYATFLQTPFPALRRAFVNGRYLAAVLTMNFVIVPIVAWFLARLAPQDPAVLIGMFLVLLTPCIDYVIVFTGLGGGDDQLVLASTPLLMLLQMALLPIYLWVFLGGDIVTVVAAGPFLEAFLLLIVAPLGLAVATQWWARRHPSGATWVTVAHWLPVPFLALTLLTVVASQVAMIEGAFGRVAGVAPLYGAFLTIMVVLGRVGASAFGLSSREGRALIFSSVTRNSLVVLPLALALGPGYELTPIVVVTQTMVELAGLLALARLAPWLVPARSLA
jgi:ACR3 family arsenite efflux pump ArsB